MLNDWLKLILGIVVIIFVGWGVLEVVWKEELNWSEKILLSFGLGVGVITWWMFLLSWGGVEFTPLVVILPWLGLVGFVSARKKFHLKKKDFSHQKKEKLTWFEILLVGTIFIAVGLVFYKSLFLPLYSWDAIAMWGTKAKILFHEPVAETRYFFDVSKSYSHLDYPLLIPLAQNYMYMLLGRVDDRLGKIIFPLFFLGLLMLIYGAGRRFFSRWYSLIFTSLVALSGAFLKWAPKGYADVPFSFFYSVATVYLWLWMQEEKQRDLLIFGIFSAFSIFTKNEGLPLFGINFLLLIIFLGINRRIRFKKLLLPVGIWLIFILPWFIFSRRIPRTHQDYLSLQVLLNVGKNFSRIPLVVKSFLAQFGNLENWGLFWPGLLITTILSVRCTFHQPLGWLFLMLGLHLCMYGGIYLLTSADVVLYLQDTLDRVLLHILPVGIILISQQLGFLNEKV